MRPKLLNSRVRERAKISPINLNPGARSRALAAARGMWLSGYCRRLAGSSVIIINTCTCQEIMCSHGNFAHKCLSGGVVCLILPSSCMPGTVSGGEREPALLHPHFIPVSSSCSCSENNPCKHGGRDDFQEHKARPSPLEVETRFGCSSSKSSREFALKHRGKESFV